MLRTLAKRSYSIAFSNRYVASTIRNHQRLLHSSTRLLNAEPSHIAPEVKDQYEFKAETKKLLNIVANSLYSDKEVFCRELISNAADAMEKLRHAQQVEGSGISSTLVGGELAIDIKLDKDAKTFTIQDCGIGMSKEEMIEYLGTIARSGSKSFVEAIDSDQKSNIIGQFGVGFYSAYMVGDKVTVYSKSAKEGAQGFRWESDGLGSYTIQVDETAEVGTKIVIHLKDDCLEFADNHVIEGIVKKYSNFVNFPVKINGTSANTIEPLWTKDSSAITDKQHTDFYRFVANAWDNYQFRLHYKTDAPVHLNTLLYVPERNTEQMGIGKMEPGVNLFSRRVLIQAKSKALLPDYLRFVRGVVESDDIPMNLSREMLQNSHLIRKLSDILTMKVLKWMQGECRKDQVKYDKFFTDFGSFLKEGICTAADEKQQKELAKLMRYESSAVDAGKYTSLKDYVERKKEGQNKILYMIASNREWADESPYLENFKKCGYEVLYMLDPIDEFVAERLPEFDGMEFLSVDSSEAKSMLKQEDSDNESKAGKFADADIAKLSEFFKETLGKSLADVKTTASSSHSHPALVMDHESPTIRRLMKMAPKQSAMFLEDTPQKLEINLNHPVIQGLNDLIKTDDKKDLARDVTHQIFDNALITAGIMDNPRTMLKRLNRLMEHAVKTKN